METITHSKLVALLDAYKGMLPVGVSTETIDGNMRVKENPYRDCVKRCKGSLTTGIHYSSAVNREGTRQEIETAFVSGPLPRKGDIWLIPNKVIYNPLLQTYYLRTETTPAQRETHSLKLVGYFMPSGEQVDLNALKPFLRKPRESAKQQAEGLEGTVWVRDWKFDSIKTITVDNKKYLVIHSESFNETQVKLVEASLIPAWVITV